MNVSFLLSPTFFSVFVTYIHTWLVTKSVYIHRLGIVYMHTMHISVTSRLGLSSSAGGGDSNIPCTCGRDRDQNFDRPKSDLDRLTAVDFRL